jgi:hypothetical protein
MILGVFDGSRPALVGRNYIKGAFKAKKLA